MNEYEQMMNDDNFELKRHEDNRIIRKTIESRKRKKFF